jgi:peroxiredoxin
MGKGFGLALLLIAAPLQAGDQPMTALVGSLAPDWALRSLGGKEYRLAKLKGKPVVRNFWATWCAPCRVESKWLAELYRQHHGSLEIIGISMDNADDDKEVAKFLAAYQVNYPVVLRGQSIADRYGGVRQLPQMFFIDSTGKITGHTRGIASSATLKAEIEQLLGAK